VARRGTDGRGEVQQANFKEINMEVMKAEALAEERKLLEKIANKNGGLLMVDDVLDEARNPKSILHKHFQWDDDKAIHLDTKRTPPKDKRGERPSHRPHEKVLTHRQGRSQHKESEGRRAFPIQRYHKLSGRVSTFNQCNTYNLFTIPVDRNYI